MFKDGSAEPHLTFQVTPTPSVTFTTVSVSLDGEVVHSKSASGNAEIALIKWPGNQHEAKLSAGTGGPELTMVGPYSGPWAVLQLFNAADDWEEMPAGKGYRVGWELVTRAQRATLPSGQAAKITLQIEANPATIAVLKKGFFAGADCGGNVAR
jgi:type VI protein secretion system component VasK